VKTYTSIIKIEFYINNMEANTKEEYIKQLQEQFKEEYNLILKKEEITNIQEES
tara:strand:- start:1396 stop:1557 length:162 start_codon:yes stop_codon:yes gene_type:complete